MSSHALKPARRKLQKSDPRSKLKAPSLDFGRSSSDSSYGLMARPAPPSEKEKMSPSGIDCPDLSDPRWFGYIEHDHPMASIDPSPQYIPPPTPSTLSPPPTPPSPRNLVPEFSHLAVSPAESRSPRPTTSRHSTLSVMRREAKTPVFQIGQLEKSALRRRQAEAAAEANRKTAAEAEAGTVEARRRSVELIAEQYRALLNFDDDESNPPTPEIGHLEQLSPLAYQETRPEDVPRKTELELPQPPNHSNLSPISDAGTLVGFEEDVIYFKPISFTPEPSPSAHQQTFGPAVHARPTQNTQSICTELLTQQLSTSLSDPNSRGDGKASFDQLQLMIRSYEKLQGSVGAMRLSEQERTDVEGAFGAWLGALRRVQETRGGG